MSKKKNINKKRTGQKKVPLKQKKITTTERKKDNKRVKTEKLIGFAALFLFFVFNTFIPDKSDLVALKISRSVFMLFSALFAVVIALPLILKNKSYSSKISKYSFFVLILYFLAASVISGLKLTEDYQLFLVFSDFLLFPTGLIGFLALYFSRKRIQNRKLHEEKPKYGRYFPIVSFFFGEKIWYSVALVLILILSISVNFYNYDKFEIFEDEYQMISAAECYQNTGTYKLWDYNNEKPGKRVYEGAYLHTWQIAQMFRLFGVSLGSARLLSSIWGVIFTIISLFVVRFFTKNRIRTLLIVLSIILFHHYIYFSHYVRMYIIFIPLFLLNAYFIFRALTEKSYFSESAKYPRFLKEKFDFKISFLPIIILLLYVCWVLHQVTLIILPVTFLYIVYLTVAKRETKYYILFAASVIAAAILAWALEDNVDSGILSFFNAKNAEFNKAYIGYILSFPFVKSFSIAILISGIGIVIFTKDERYRNKLIFLYFFIPVTLVVFIYVFNYHGIAFRYTSHIALIALILTSSIFIFQNKILYNKVLQTILNVSFIAIVTSSFYANFENLYEKNQLYGSPSTAYSTLEENFDPETETIFGQYFKYYHFRKIKDFKLVDMRNNKRYEFERFIKDIQQAKTGWLIWMTNKSYHINQQILDFIFQNFKQYHGHKFDDTLMELYYFDESMIPGTPAYAEVNQDVFNTNAYINLSKENTITFWLKTNAENPGVPVFFGNKTENPVKLLEDNGSYTFTYNGKTGINTGKLNDDKWHHVVWKQSEGKSWNKFSIYVDAVKIEEKRINTRKTGRVRLLISTLFKGQMQDMRVFYKELTESQIRTIYNNGNYTLEEKLISENEEFIPNAHFTVR